MTHYQCAVLLEVKVLVKENNKYLPQVANSGSVEGIRIVLMRVPHGWKRNRNQVDNCNTCRSKHRKSECGEQPVGMAQGAISGPTGIHVPASSTSESPF